MDARYASGSTEAAPETAVPAPEPFPIRSAPRKTLRLSSFSPKPFFPAPGRFQHVRPSSFIHPLMEKPQKAVVWFGEPLISALHNHRAWEGNKHTQRQANLRRKQFLQSLFRATSRCALISRNLVF